MYGLPQAGLLSNKLLQKTPRKYEYYQSKLVPGLWKHETHSIQFTLVAENFGVKYTHNEDANYLIAAIRASKYRVNED